MEAASLRACIANYFHLGMKIADIKMVLRMRHGVIRSIRHIRRLLNAMGLYSRVNLGEDYILDVAHFIELQQKNSSNMLGYRAMHIRCRQAGYTVPRDTVYYIMKLVNPEGIAARRARRLQRRQYFAKGPNYIWHMDGYDKLKPFGIAIHGCIDGYSREIIWLNAYKTNNCPKVIAGYYLEAVCERGGCPTILRADRGTENSRVRRFQRFFRRHGTDKFSGERSFLYGRSTANQRIESWWGILRKQCIQFWMNLLGSLRDQGTFTGDILDKGLVQFCFTKLIQEDLDRLVTLWSEHHIRITKNTNVPNGRPFLLYYFPELVGTQDYIRSVTFADTRHLIADCILRSVPCDEETYEIFEIIMCENN